MGSAAVEAAAAAAVSTLSLAELQEENDLSLTVLPDKSNSVPGKDNGENGITETNNGTKLLFIRLTRVEENVLLEDIVPLKLHQTVKHKEMDRAINRCSIGAQEKERKVPVGHPRRLRRKRRLDLKRFLQPYDVWPPIHKQKERKSRMTKAQGHQNELVSSESTKQLVKSEVSPSRSPLLKTHNLNLGDLDLSKDLLNTIIRKMSKKEIIHKVIMQA